MRLRTKQAGSKATTAMIINANLRRMESQPTPQFSHTRYTLPSESYVSCNNIRPAGRYGGLRTIESGTREWPERVAGAAILFASLGVRSRRRAWRYRYERRRPHRSGERRVLVR